MNATAAHSFQRAPLTERDLYDALGAGLVNSSRPFTFLVGSALAYPEPRTRLGVPSASAMVSLIQEELDANQISYDKTALTDYATAFRKLRNVAGQDSVNRVIQRAVLMSRTAPPNGSSRNDAPELGILRALDASLEGWHIPRAIEVLGRLMALYPTAFGQRALTTNFDPLLELALIKRGRAYFVSALHADGSLDGTSGSGTHVVHLHGHWCRSDTLHTPEDLMQPRPQLLNSLKRLLGSSTVVVMGYSGWDDLFMDALREILADPGAAPEVMWCFYEKDWAMIQSSSTRVLEKLSSNVRRVRLFSGIDARKVLPEALRRCRIKRIAENPATAIEPFRKALFDTLIAGATSSAGDLAKRIQEAEDSYVSCRITFAAVRGIVAGIPPAQRGLLSRFVAATFDDSETWLRKGDIPMSELGKFGFAI